MSGYMKTGECLPAALEAGCVRRVAASLLCLAVLIFAGCSRSNSTAATEEEPPFLEAVVHASDPQTTFQLVKGFYPVENDSWRWTKGQFAVLLATPPASAVEGAVLRLKVAVPEIVIERLGPISLSAEVEGVALPPETYSKPGDYEYVREVPAQGVTAESVTAVFELDKMLAAGTVERRELGIIFSSVALEPK